MVASLTRAEYAAIQSDTRAAVRRHGRSLRQLGAIGTIEVGVDPEVPSWRWWWARVTICRMRGGPTSTVTLDGQETADGALAGLVAMLDDRTTR